MLGRPLDRLRRHAADHRAGDEVVFRRGHVTPGRQLEELALVGELLARPDLEDDVERLDHLPLPGGWVLRHLEDDRLARTLAAALADAELEPPVTEVVEQGCP